MRIAIFGTGGVGGYFGGRLAQAGEDVVFIARGDHLQAMSKHGLRVDSINGDFVLESVQATDDPAQIGQVDVVLVGVKAWQVPETAEAIRPMVGSLNASATRAIQTTMPASAGRSSATSVRNLKYSRDAADSTRLTV